MPPATQMASSWTAAASECMRRASVSTTVQATGSRSRSATSTSSRQSSTGTDGPTTTSARTPRRLAEGAHPPITQSSRPTTTAAWSVLPDGIGVRSTHRPAAPVPPLQVGAGANGRPRSRRRLRGRGPSPSLTSAAPRAGAPVQTVVQDASPGEERIEGRPLLCPRRRGKRAAALPNARRARRRPTLRKGRRRRAGAEGAVSGRAAGARGFCKKGCAYAVVPAPGPRSGGQTEGQRGACH